MGKASHLQGARLVCHRQSPPEAAKRTSASKKRTVPEETKTGCPTLQCAWPHWAARQALPVMVLIQKMEAPQKVMNEAI